MIGDVNHDGEITTYDALLIMRYALGLETEGNELIMDFNGDGCVDSLDALLVLRRSIGAGITVSASTVVRSRKTA